MFTVVQTGERRSSTELSTSLGENKSVKNDRWLETKGRTPRHFCHYLAKKEDKGDLDHNARAAARVSLSLASIVQSQARPQSCNRDVTLRN
jgi:hypothetical protein